MNKLLLSFTSFLVITMQGWCYPDNYGPFEPGCQPKPWPVQECLHLQSATDRQNKADVFVKDTNSTLRVIISSRQENDGYFAFVKIQNSSGRDVLPKTGIDGNAACGLKVYWGFLNEDKQPDYIVQTWSGGCGLAAGYSYQTFMLSSEGAFRVARVITLYPSEDMDLVDLNQDGSPELIHTAFIYGEKGKDGKTHNYWVYNLLQFKGDQVISANHVDSRFPCWVWFTDKPNHKNTVQLTDEQKRRLWKVQASNLFLDSAELTSEPIRSTNYRKNKEVR